MVSTRNESVQAQARAHAELPPGAGADSAPVAVAICRLLERIGRLTRGIQYAAGLNPAQWEALRFLALANRHSRTPTGLSAFLGATKGTTSQTLASLEDKGLVTRIMEPSDRRCVKLELTASGRAILADDPLTALTGAVAALSGPAQQQLACALEELLRGVAAQRGAPEFGVCQRCGHLEGDCGRGDAHCALLDEALSVGDTRSLCVDFAPVRKPD